MPISKDVEARKNPEVIFKAIGDTLEVSTSYWNYIDKMYSDIRRGEQESTDQLDQCIKNIVKRCQYSTEAEKLVHRIELLFHVTKHFEVKKWVRSKKKREDIMYESLLQHAKEHEMRVKDFNRHKSNGGTVRATSMDEIINFKQKKGNGYRAKSSSGKPCSKYSTSHPPRECSAFSKKYHKCELKTILAVVVGLNTRAREMVMVEDHPKLRAQTDITDLKAEADAPDPEVDPIH